MSEALAISTSILLKNQLQDEQLEETRLDLHYPALLSIPVIYDENIVLKINDAYKQKQQKKMKRKP